MIVFDVIVYDVINDNIILISEIMKIINTTVKVTKKQQTQSIKTK